MKPLKGSSDGNFNVHSKTLSPISLTSGLHDQRPQRFLREKLASATSLYKGDFRAHYGCVNAIEFSNHGGHMIASGGDDRRVLLWNTEKAMWMKESPASMKSEHHSNIFCLAFDKDNDKIFSGGNDEQVFVHDAATGNPVDNFMHEDAVYGLATDPNNTHVFASACDDGRVLIYDIREPADSEPFCLANYMSSMHSVMFNPAEPRLLATANAREGIGLWDVRKPKSCLMRYGGEFEQQSCMSVRINSLGNQLLALRRRLPPVIYNIESPLPVVEFDHTGYFNSCTMKSCCFAGDKDQYVLSGSDNFNVYMWAIPGDLSERQFVNSAHLVLKGHRSIVNQVRYNINNGLIISSGVEKTIKAWSAYPLHGLQRDITVCDTQDVPVGERDVYTHEEYINLVLRVGHVMSHDYTHQSTDEDPRMMAFFDSLVQREMETLSSSEEFSSNEEELYERILQVAREPPDPVTPRLAEDVDSDNSTDEFSPFTLAFASIMAARTEEQNGGSRLLNLDEQTDSDASDSSDDNVDAPRNANRRTISEIIANNKKETQGVILKKEMSSKLKQTVKRPFSSDTESDEEPSSWKTQKLQKVDDEQGECSTSTAANYTSNTASTMNFGKTRTKSGKLRFHLKKLRELRSHVLNSDSDTNDNSQSAQCNPVSAEQSSSDVTSCVDNSTKGNEYGPFLKEVGEFVIPRFDNLYKNTEDNSINNKVCDNINLTSTSVQNEKTGTCSKNSDSPSSNEKSVCELFTSVSSINNNISHHGNQENMDACRQNNNLVEPSVEICSDKLSSVDNKFTDVSSDRKMTSLTNGVDQSSTSCSDSNINKMKSEQNDNYPTTSSSEKSSTHYTKCEPTWSEFKRFSRTLERARRYYRRHSGSQPSSDEDI